jgi:hypothetical protein
MIVNNLAGLAGGGISLQDAVNVNLVHNTIANNDSLAVAGEAFAPGSPNQSTPQPGAGLVSRFHSQQLGDLADAPFEALVGTFSIPNTFTDNIIWQNRQFYYFAEALNAGLCPDLNGVLTCPTGNTVVFDDVGIVGSAAVLTGTTNLLTPGGWTGPFDTLFVAEYFNVGRTTLAIQVPAAGDEGGNFIRPNYNPLALYNDAAPNDGAAGTLYGDYHILPGSAAQDSGTSNTPATDIDGDVRPQFVFPDIGADETTEAAPAPAAAAPAAIIQSPIKGNALNERKKLRRQKSDRTR